METEITMILVTGVTGLSGSAVIREFARQNEPVRALVRNRTKAQELEAFPNVEIVEGDMLRPETLHAALDGVERVLMISSAAERLLETQRTFIDASKKAGVRHIVKFSGAEASIGFNTENFRTARMHEEIERYLEGSGLAWTHLRPCQFMQFYFPGAPAMLLSENALSLPMENARLSPVDIEDIAKIAFRLLRDRGGHEGRSYDITGPESLTMTEVAERISQATGRTIQYLNVSMEEFRRAMLAAGASPERADAFVELWGERRKSSASRVDLSTHETFGVQPTTFAEFARRNASVFRGESGHFGIAWGMAQR
jgi:uncharacterized protein YbjT (DUF2867 family)